MNYSSMVQSPVLIFCNTKYCVSGKGIIVFIMLSLVYLIRLYICVGMQYNLEIISTYYSNVFTNRISIT